MTYVYSKTLVCKQNCPRNMFIIQSTHISQRISRTIGSVVITWHSASCTTRIARYRLFFKLKFIRNICFILQNTRKTSYLKSKVFLYFKSLSIIYYCHNSCKCFFLVLHLIFNFLKCLWCTEDTLYKAKYTRACSFFFFERERQRERKSMSVSRTGAEREGDTKSEADSRLWDVSTEPDAGPKPVNHELMTWAGVGPLTDWATQAPLGLVLLFLPGIFLN